MDIVSHLIYSSKVVIDTYLFFNLSEARILIAVSIERYYNKDQVNH